jgi:hypothetical protein
MKMKSFFPKFFIAVAFMYAATTASFPMQRTFDGKIGGGYAFDPEHWGLNLEGTYLWNLDPFFAAGLQSGVFWVKWEETRGKKNIGATPTEVKATTNALSVPFLAIAQLRLPNVKDKIHFLPYLNIGMGGSAMYISYSDPAYTDSTGVRHSKETENKVFGGFTWETVIGAAVSPSGSNIDFLFETGYVGSKLYHGNDNVNMSRFIANIGVRFTFDK